MLNLVLSLLGTYVLICIGAWVLHRYFLYLPDKKRYAPREVGLADVEEIEVAVREDHALPFGLEALHAASQDFAVPDQLLGDSICRRNPAVPLRHTRRIFSAATALGNWVFARGAKRGTRRSDHGLVFSRRPA